MAILMFMALFEEGLFVAREARINARQMDFETLMSGTFPIADAVAAFEAAGDRNRSMKIHLSFT